VRKFFLLAVLSSALVISSAPEANAGGGFRATKAKRTKEPTASIRGLTWRRSVPEIRQGNGTLKWHGARFWRGAKASTKIAKRIKPGGVVRASGKETRLRFGLELTDNGHLVVGETIDVAGKNRTEALRAAAKSSPLILFSDRAAVKAGLPVEGLSVSVFFEDGAGWSATIGRKIPPGQTFNTSSLFPQTYTIDNPSLGPTAK